LNYSGSLAVEKEILKDFLYWNTSKNIFPNRNPPRPLETIILLNMKAFM
jgi:hypothetical protein